VALIPVANDEVPTVVTTLRMRTPRTRNGIAGSPLRLIRWPAPDPARYRALFRRVGAPWLWYSRLAMDDTALAAIIGDAEVEVYAVCDPTGGEVGMVELDFRVGGRCEIAYFGLVPALMGRGHGRWLMAATLAHAWRAGIGEVGVNTCTLDSPGALGFYRAQGFTVVRRTLETFADPRALGLLPADAAPHIPYLASRR
jgi:GNAT superfamily N-acetyltransferase